MDAPAPRPRRWRLPRTFAALQHRNYRLFFGGQLISVTGTWMQNLALAWLTYQLTNSKLLLGLIGAVGSLPMSLLAVPGGALADRGDKRRILLATQSAAMLLAFVLTALSGTGVIRVWHIAVLAALGGTVMAVDMPTRQAFVVEMVGKRELMNAIALNSSIFNSARIIGPAIAGALVAGLGPTWCFFINGLSFLAVLVSLLLMQFPPRPARAFTTSVLTDAFGGLRYLVTNRALRQVVALLAVFSVFGWSYGVLMPVFARDVLKAGARGLGYLMTSNGIGALAGALTVATLSEYPRKQMLFGGAFVLSAALIGFALSRTFLLSAALLALVGLGGVAFMSTANTTIQVSVPDEMRGRVMGVWGLVFAGTAPLGSLQAGTIAQYLTAPDAVAIGACITGCAAVVALIAARRRVADEPP